MPLFKLSRSMARLSKMFSPQERNSAICKKFSHRNIFRLIVPIFEFDFVYLYRCFAGHAYISKCTPPIFQRYQQQEKAFLESFLLCQLLQCWENAVIEGSKIPLVAVLASKVHSCQGISARSIGGGVVYEPPDIKLFALRSLWLLVMLPLYMLARE